MKGTEKNPSTKDTIRTLKGTEGIRKRFGMYIGSAGEEGVIRLFYEALGNAIDEFQAGRASNILVKINEKTSEIIISDDGMGIPIKKIEDACTKLHTSGKFENDYSKISIGQNGVGLKVINALSEKLTVLVKRDGYKWKTEFSKGEIITHTTKVSKLNKNEGTGTTLSFIPDITVLKDITINAERYKKFLEISSYLNKGLVFDFIAELNSGKRISEKIVSKNGMLDYMLLLDNKFLLAKPLVFTDSTEYDESIIKKTGKKDEKGKDITKEEKTGEKVYMEAEVMIQYSRNDTNLIKTLCNGFETTEGGSHEVGFKMAITEVFTKAIKNSNILTKKDGNIEITPEDIREGLVAIVNVKHSNPIYKSQTKDKLDVTEVQWFVKKLVVDQLTRYLSTNQNQAKIIYQRIITSAKARMAANRAKNAKKKEAAGLINGLSSLSKVIRATGDDPKNLRCFIVEGDSAAGSVINGRCTKSDSVFLLKGKPLNTYDSTIQRIEANKEFADLITLLGCGFNNTFDISKLTHNQIIVLSDSDIDGFHIRVLLATFFFKHMPEIITGGHFYIGSAPLYKVEENGKVMFFNDNNDYNSYLADKILKKYNIGKFIKKDGKTVAKKFSKEKFIEFLSNTERYLLLLENIANTNAIDQNLIELIANYCDLDFDKLKLKIENKFNELKCINHKNKKMHIEGMIKNQYQYFDIDKKFKEQLKDINDIIEDYSYKNMYLEEIGKEKKKLFISSILNEVITFGTPKHRQRFKGLGEMDYDELWETTLRPEAGGIIQIKAKDMKELADVFEVQVGKDASKRKIFLENFFITPDDIDN